MRICLVVRCKFKYTSVLLEMRFVSKRNGDYFAGNNKN